MTAEGQECTSGVTVDMFSILLVLVLTQVLNWSELTNCGLNTSAFYGL